ncbi:helix-turn-helix domain-containing protein [Candidatus Micrarchaeota archaeon]|nr:helix-turn-helix domain-containing protein [Candidatus Micrarchaeota archaeon]
MDFVPCDYAVKTLLPAIRCETAELLAKEGWTQQRIASALGLSQAAVSKYLSAREKAAPEVARLAHAVAQKILSGKGKVELRLCKACGGKGLLICALSKK